MLPPASNAEMPQQSISLHSSCAEQEREVLELKQNIYDICRHTVYKATHNTQAGSPLTTFIPPRVLLM